MNAKPQLESLCGLAQHAARGGVPERNEGDKNCLLPNERDDPGFVISQSKRKLVEKIFGWMKSAAGLRKTKLRGTCCVDWQSRLYAAAVDLIRLGKLMQV
jgi:hypothetical protein